MTLAVALLVNNLGLFLLEIIGYHVCHSVVMLLDGYYRLCQAILCTVRIFSRRIQSTYTPRHTYGLARVGVVGELVAFVSFFSLSISVFLETIKHLIDVVITLPQRESNGTKIFTAHGSEHIHSLIDHPYFILGVGTYATISNSLLGIAVLYVVMKRSAKLRKQLKQRRPSLKQPLPKKILSKSLLITDSLPVHHSILQVLNMILGPIAILICGCLLVLLSERANIRVIYSRLVDPIAGCLLFLSYLFMIVAPMREVMHLVLQANPHRVTSDQVEKALRDTIPGVASIHELHIWRLTPHRTLATVHVVFNTTDQVQMKYQDINLIFQTLNIDHVTIQPEFSLMQNEIEKLGCLYQCAPANVECEPLRCCETTNDKSKTDTPPPMHFPRRSSFNLPVDDDNSSEE